MNRPAPVLTAGAIERRPFRLGGATIDPVSREASWNGGSERLQPQILKVLLTLARRRGEVVTRDELVQLCWGGRVVGDDVINRAISLLRQLAERAGGFEIETVPRTGYRLAETEPVSGRVARRWWIAVAAGVALAIGAIAGWAWMHHPRGSQGLPPTPSVTIRPFEVAANDPLARQVAQAAPISLSHMLAESGFATVRDDPSNGASRKSDYVFKGLIRRTGNSLEATLQLVSTRDGTIAFAHDFSAPIGSAADLPDRIGATAAAELAWTAADMALDPREHLDPQIESELMEAMTLTIEQGDSLRAYQLARHAAQMAPDSAIAQLTLGVQTAFSISSIPVEERAGAVALGRQASERALALAPEFGDVYLTWCLLHSPVRMTECDARVRHAFDVDPSSSFVPGYLSELDYNAGRIEASLPLGRQSFANDPYKPAKMARMIRLLEATGQSDEAQRVYQQGTRLWPDSGRMRVGRIVGMAERGNYAGLQAFVVPAIDGGLLHPSAFSALMAANANRDLSAAQHACGAKGLNSFTLSMCMTVLADLGDRNRSFAIADALYPAWHPPRGADEEQIWLAHPDGFDTAILTGPAARAMRTDPRFIDLAQKLGLVTYWRKVGLPDFCTRTHEPECKAIGGK